MPEVSEAEVVHESQDEYGEVKQKLFEKKKKEKNYFAYPKTCGFAWNCFGNMVFFSNEKYNFKSMEKQPNFRKFFEWPNPSMQLLGGDVFDYGIETGPINEGFNQMVEVDETHGKNLGQNMIHLGKNYSNSTDSEVISSSSEGSYNDLNNSSSYLSDSTDSI